MKILLTGSTGFVGNHLIPVLKDADCDLYHLVRKKRGLRQEFIWDFSGPLPENIPACEVVIHLAAHVDFSSKMDVSLYTVNTLSAAKLARYCQETDASLIVASTIGVHVSSGYVSANAPVVPTSHYGMSKYLAEEIVKTFVSDVSILRISGIYGLNGPAHLGLNTAINKAAIKKIAPILKGPGQGKRNYICVSDVARWVLHLALRRNKVSSPRRDRAVEILYLAGPEIMSIEEYLQTIIEVLLPGEELVRLEGSESEDCIVENSLAPFSLTTFREYLTRARKAFEAASYDNGGE